MGHNICDYLVGITSAIPLWWHRLLPVGFPSVPSLSGAPGVPSTSPWLAGCKKGARIVWKCSELHPCLKNVHLKLGIRLLKWCRALLGFLSSAFLEIIKIFPRLESYLENNKLVLEATWSFESWCSGHEPSCGRCGNPQNCWALGWNLYLLTVRCSTLRRGSGGGICSKGAPTALPAQQRLLLVPCPCPLPGHQVG